MMEDFCDFCDFLKFTFACVTIPIIMLFFAVLSFTRYIIIPYTYGSIITVEIDNTTVFTGPVYLTEIVTSGSTTQVSIRNNDYFTTLKSKYVSNNVKVYPVE